MEGNEKGQTKKDKHHKKNKISEEVQVMGEKLTFMVKAREAVYV
jgi:hypothetical protein